MQNNHDCTVIKKSRTYAKSFRVLNGLHKFDSYGKIQEIFSFSLYFPFFFKPKLKIYFCKLLWATPCVVTCNRLSKSYFARTKKLFVPIISFLFWTNLEIKWQIFKINVILFNFFFKLILWAFDIFDSVPIKSTCMHRLTIRGW